MLTLLCPTHSNSCGRCETPAEKQSKIVSSVNITGSRWQTQSRWSRRSSLVHRRTTLWRSNYAPVLRGRRELVRPALASPMFTDKPQRVSNILLRNPLQQKHRPVPNVLANTVMSVLFRRHKRPQVPQRTS